MTSEERDILVKAKGLIAQGWVQGTLWTFDPDTRQRNAFCIKGALLAAQGVMHDPNLEWEYLNRKTTHLEGLLGLRYGEACSWNNNPDRTQAQVIDLFDKALTRDEELVPA